MSGNRGSYKFITEPSATLKCVICLEVAVYPRQHVTCGKLFCRECILKNGNKPCPNCRKEDPQYFPDTKSDREIKELRVICENVVEKGCGWEGTIRTLEDHVTTCPFALVSCTNKCKVEGQILKMMRQDLDHHLETECRNRRYKCQHCGKEGTFSSITGEYDGVCAKKVMPCPNTGCTLAMERGLVSKHIEAVCEYTEVACQYESIGCGTRKFRKDIRQHEEGDNKTHFSLSLNKLVEMESRITATEEKSSLLMAVKSSLEDKVSSSVMRSGITFKVPGYKKMRRDKSQFYSKPFYTSTHHGYKINIHVYANGRGKGEGTHVSIFNILCDGPHNDELPWPFMGTITFELLNQLENKNHHRMIMQYEEKHDIRVGTSYGFPTFFPHSKLSHDPASNTQYLKDNALYFRVTVKVAKPWLATGTLRLL